MATVVEILKALVHSDRGKIFLCNLEAALGMAVVDQGKLRVTLLKQLDADIRFDAYDALLGIFKCVLLALSRESRRRRQTQGIDEGFSAGGRIVSVMEAEDFRHYRNSPIAASGHDFDDPARLGWRSVEFKQNSKTLEFFWAAPQAVVPSQIDQQSAQQLQDRLGLVHYPRNTPLIVLAMRLPANHPWSRPTILEAVPNARFRQLHPETPEARWGFTVDLEKLEGAEMDESIAGVPEVVVEGVKLRECSEVEFFSLGATHTDRSTTGADTKFLAHVQGSREFESVFASLERLLDLPLHP